MSLGFISNGVCKRLLGLLEGLRQRLVAKLFIASIKMHTAGLSGAKALVASLASEVLVRTHEALFAFLKGLLGFLAH